MAHKIRNLLEKQNVTSPLTATLQRHE